jgi:hypothetical protein
MRRMPFLTLVVLGSTLAVGSIIAVLVDRHGSQPEKVFRVPAGIPSDCSNDAQPALTRFIATVPDHSEIVFPGGSCYLLGASLEVDGADDLTIDGSGSTIRSAVALPDCQGGPPSGPDADLWVIKNSDQVRLRDFRLVGTNPQPGVYDGTHYCQHGVELLGSSDVVLSDVSVSNVWGDCVYVWYDDPQTKTQSTDDLVTGLTCAGSGREGISSVASTSLTITHSSFTNLRNGVTTDRNTINDQSPNLAVMDNTFSGVKKAMVNLAGGGADNAVVSGNTCDSSRPCLIYVHGDPTDPIEEVSITDNSSPALAISSGWQVANVDDLVIQGNAYLCPLSSAGTPFREFLRFSGMVNNVRVIDNTVANCIMAKDATAGSIQTDVVMQGNSLSPGP